MKNNLLLSLHTKAIAVIDAYYEAERRANNCADELRRLNNDKWARFDSTNYYEKRLAANTAIMARLQAYYTRIIDKINTHKP